MVNHKKDTQKQKETKKASQQPSYLLLPNSQLSLSKRMASINYQRIQTFLLLHPKNELMNKQSQPNFFIFVIINK